MWNVKELIWKELSLNRGSQRPGGVERRVGEGGQQGSATVEEEYVLVLLWVVR